MASKAIQTILNLKDKFSAPIGKVSQNAKKMQNQIKHVDNQIKKFRDNAVNNFKNIAKSAAGLVASYVAISKAVEFGKESIELAKAQIAAETKLAAVYKATGKANAQQIQGLKNHASALQNVGVIGDEVTLAGMSQLATFNLTSKTVEKLSEGMLDLAVNNKGLNASQEDLFNIGNMLGKVMGGQVGALSRVGISFTKAQEQIIKFGTEEQKAATLAEVLRQNVGGVNKAMAQTDQGKIQQMKNAWGDYKEEVGKKILPLQAKLAGWFFTKIPKIQSLVLGLLDKTSAGITKASAFILSAKRTIESNKAVIDSVKSKLITLQQIGINTGKWFIETFANVKKKVDDNKSSIDGLKRVLIDLSAKALEVKEFMVSAFSNAKPTIQWLKTDGIPAIIEHISKFLDKITAIYNFFNDNWTTIEPLVYGIVGAFAAYKAITLTVTAITKAWTIIQGAATIAMTAFSAALAFITSPIGITVLAIGALIAIGVAVYKNWELIKIKAVEIWSKIESFLSSFPLGAALLQNIKNRVIAIKEVFGGIITFVKGVFTGDWKQAWEGVKQIFKGVFDGLAAIVKSPLNTVIGLVNQMIERINKINVKVPDWVPGVGGKQFGANIPKIPNFATGTSYHRGGPAEINEGKRGEIVNLPNGSKVIPHDLSKKMTSKGNNLPPIQVTILGNVIGNEEYLEQIGNLFYQKLQLYK